MGQGKWKKRYIVEWNTTGSWPPPRGFKGQRGGISEAIICHRWHINDRECFVLFEGRNCSLLLVSFGVFLGVESRTTLSRATCVCCWISQENISFMAFFRAVSKMMKISKIDDFSLTDISDPKRPRWARVVAIFVLTITYSKKLIAAVFTIVSWCLLVLGAQKIKHGDIIRGVLPLEYDQQKMMIWTV